MPVLRDRRRDYEARHRALGMCHKCASQAVESGGRCFRHWMFYHLAKRGLTKGHLTEKNRKLRELFVASLYGRYQAILGGFLEPVTDQQRLVDAMELRARLGIGWAGQGGVRKTASLIRNIERRALKLRKEKADG